MHSYDKSHYMVEDGVYSDIISGSLCGEFGWHRGPGLTENPLDFRPMCKKCKKVLETLHA